MILVLGGSGYVGSEIVRRLATQGVPHRPLSRGDCDYYDAAQLGALIEQTSASFLINAAGFVGQPNVDACERQRTECLLGNAVLPGIIKQVCENATLPWAHVSTGCIFTEPAPRESGFQETDPPNFCFRHDNCSFYSGSKALGEEMLWDAPQCYIWRLRMPFHHRDHPKNFLSKMIRYDRLVDARNSLTHLEDFARLCLECWERRLPFGTYHLTNPGSITTREVVALIQASGVVEKDYAFFESMDQFQAQAVVAPRSTCVLDTQKARAAGLEAPPVQAAIAEALRNWQSTTR